MKKETTFLPAPFNDFETQKDLTQAFYTWLILLDNKTNIELLKDQEKIDRPNMCNQQDFHVLFITFLEFLDQLGLKVINKNKTRKKSLHPDVADFLSLAKAWQSVVNPKGIQAMPFANALNEILNWKDYIPYMPERVKKALINTDGDKK